jgi:hypothetical protein
MTPLGRPCGGVTLIEVALCLVCLGLASLTALQAARAFADAHATRQSDAALEEAKAALLGFAQTHGHLPCPALADPSSGMGAFAAPHAAGECARGYAGALPAATLGLGGEPRARRILYRVVPDFANAVSECEGRIDPTSSICVDPTVRSPWPAHRDALEVRERRGSGSDGAHTEIVANGLAVVLVAATDATDASAPVAGSDAARNLDPRTVSFIMRGPTPASRDCDDARSGAAPCRFEQRIAWISRGEVIRRLVLARRVR